MCQTRCQYKGSKKQQKSKASYEETLKGGLQEENGSGFQGAGYLALSERPGEVGESLLQVGENSRVEGGVPKGSDCSSGPKKT